VVCAQPFDNDDLDRIAKEVNDTIYGLAASVWTRNIGTAHKLASRIRSGTVWINCHNVFDASLPFGGYKHRAGAARWAKRCSTTTPRSRRSPPRCEFVDRQAMHPSSSYWTACVAPATLWR
jgi:delta 1-pyrroline-5-carboxylate dehydrogenase